jgi:hypothetical protein
MLDMQTPQSGARSNALEVVDNGLGKNADHINGDNEYHCDDTAWYNTTRQSYYELNEMNRSDSGCNESKADLNPPNQIISDGHQPHGYHDSNTRSDDIIPLSDDNTMKWSLNNSDLDLKKIEFLNLDLSSFIDLKNSGLGYFDVNDKSFNHSDLNRSITAAVCMMEPDIEGDEAISSEVSFSGNVVLMFLTVDETLNLIVIIFSAQFDYCGDCPTES